MDKAFGNATENVNYILWNGKLVPADQVPDVPDRHSHGWDSQQPDDLWEQ